MMDEPLASSLEEVKMINGHSQKLDGPDSQREVWLGKNEAGEWCIKFTSAAGEATNIKISPEAMDALISLRGYHDHPGITRWKMVANLKGHYQAEQSEGGS